MFLLNIFLSLWPVGKDLLIRLINSLPMLVLTFLLYGGLNHITFLRHLHFALVVPVVLKEKNPKGMNKIGAMFTTDILL